MNERKISKKFKGTWKKRYIPNEMKSNTIKYILGSIGTLLLIWQIINPTFIRTIIAMFIICWSICLPDEVEE